MRASVDRFPTGNAHGTQSFFLVDLVLNLVNVFGRNDDVAAFGKAGEQLIVSVVIRRLLPFGHAGVMDCWRRQRAAGEVGEDLPAVLPSARAKSLAAARMSSSMSSVVRMHLMLLHQMQSG